MNQLWISQCIVTLAFSIISFYPALCQKKESSFAFDQLIVRLKSTEGERSGSTQRKINIHLLDSINTAYPCKMIKSWGRHRQKSHSVTSALSEMYTLFFDPTEDINSVIKSYQETGLFEYVEPNYIGHAAATFEIEIPNDEKLTEQWYVNNDGSFSLSPSKPDADIDLDAAWDIIQGDTTIVVAILDSGIKLDHPEFEGRFWRNPNESLNSNDDDDNGNIDDIHGWNFVSNNNDISDDNRHGTHITGVLAATGNNGIGFAGVDWKCKLMICKVLDNTASGYYSWWSEAIYYAVDNGAKVINMSLGGDSYSQSLKEAVDYAYSQGVVIVTSMQNDNTSKIYYPAAYENTIAVGSSDPDDNRSTSFVKNTSGGSNYGDHLDVLAPGNFMYGLNHLNNNYNSLFGGTSLATPIVSGIASLIAAQNPNRTAQEIKSIILTTSEDMVGNPLEDTPGWDPYYGFGRVNAYNALRNENNGLVGDVILYPVPTNNEININYIMQGTSFLNIYLTSMDGKTIHLESIPTTREYKETLILDKLSEGIYAITLESRFGRISKRILITR